jgi:hypothetical protein
VARYTASDGELSELHILPESANLLGATYSAGKYVLSFHDSKGVQILAVPSTGEIGDVTPEVVFTADRADAHPSVIHTDSSWFGAVNVGRALETRWRGHEAEQLPGKSIVLPLVELAARGILGVKSDYEPINIAVAEPGSAPALLAPLSFDIADDMAAIQGDADRVLVAATISDRKEGAVRQRIAYQVVEVKGLTPLTGEGGAGGEGGEGQAGGGSDSGGAGGAPSGGMPAAGEDAGGSPMAAGGSGGADDVAAGDDCAPNQSSGCGCRMVGSTMPEAPAGLAGLGLSLLLVGRRLRRRAAKA